MTKQELTDHTLAVWQSRSPRRLSKEDAREIIGNLTNFFAILAEWSREKGRDRADATSNTGIDA
jgi:hypothetical protein